MAELRKVTVEFDKNERSGRLRIEFLPKLSEPQDRLALTAKFKEEVEPVLVKDGFSGSYLFKVVGVPFYDSGHSWIDFELDLIRDNKPPEWSERLYKAYITRQVRQLCNFVKEHVDSIEEGFLQEKLPEVSKTIQFVED